MKLAVETRPVERGATAATGEFKIKATAKAFNILSSGLYSDKILAIIRELSCNAYDAHVAAGKADVPFEVHLPTIITPTFYVKDFGIGLSEDAVMNLYTTYFESTKADSNEYIGALGLGSKSPFSYTSTFTVESRFNGTKHVFTAYLNEQGLPSIDKLASIPTDEANGLTVMFPVQRDHISVFRAKARRAFMYFNPLPKVLGWSEYTPHAVKVLLEGTAWKLVDRTDSYLSGPYVKQGPVIYPINIEILEREGSFSTIAQTLLKQSIDIEVNMGDVDVAASREALSYDKRTIRNLINAFETVAAEFTQKVSENFKQASTLWEARQFLSTLMNYNERSIGRLLESLITNNALKITWKNQVISSSDFEADLSFIQHVNVATVYLSKHLTRLVSMRTTSTPEALQRYFVKVRKNTFVLFADLATKPANNNVIAQFLKANNSGGLDATAIVITPRSRKKMADAKQEALRIAKEFGDAPILNVSALPFEPTKREGGVAYKARSKDTVLVWKGFSLRRTANRSPNTYSRHTWDTAKCDFAAGGLYILVDRFTPMWNGKPVKRLDRIMQVMHTLNIKLDVNPVAMNEKQVQAAQKAGNWKEFFSVLKEEIERLNKDGSISRSLLYKQAIDNYSLKTLLHTSPKWVAMIMKHYPNPKSVFSKTMMLFAQIQNVKYKDDLYNLEEACFLFGLLSEEEMNKQHKNLKDAWSYVREAHPMLSFVNFESFYLSPDKMETILRYVEGSC